MVSESVLSGNSAAANVLVFFAHVCAFISPGCPGSGCAALRIRSFAASLGIVKSLPKVVAAIGAFLV